MFRLGRIYSRVIGAQPKIRRSLCSGVVGDNDVANIQKFNDFVVVMVKKDRSITPGVMVPRPSDSHGTGMFAVKDIPRGTVLCVTGPSAKSVKDPDYSDESELINDLNYTHSRKSIGLDKAIADYSYADYQTMINEYCNMDAVTGNTNVVITSLNEKKKYHVEAARDIKEGEELSRFYTIQYWMNYHLTVLMRAAEEKQVEDKSLYESSHPLIRSMLELTDPYSMRCFAAVRNFHDSAANTDAINNPGN